MAETSFSTTTRRKTAVQVQYGTNSSSTAFEIIHGDVKVSISSVLDESSNTEDMYGNLTISYTLTSYEVNNSSIDVQYSYSAGGSYYDCTRRGSEGDGINALSVSSSGNSYTFVWDTAQDLGKYYKDVVYIRIRAYDKVNQNGDFNISNLLQLKINNSPSAPTISSPADGIFTKDQTPEIIFTISDPKVGYSKVHFKVELDISSDFDSNNLKVFESRNEQDRVNFFYYDGSNYVAVPETGVDLISDITLVGNNVKFEVPVDNKLSSGNWYIRVTEGETIE